MTTRIAILGGGVAGCVLARQLACNPALEIDIIERDERLGGLHRSVDVDGTAFDIGAFIFHVDHPMFDVFAGLRDMFLDVAHYPRSITPHGTIDDYPLTPRGYLRDNGAMRMALAGVDLLAAKVRWRRRDSMPAYLRYYLGETMYRASGMKDYLERFYQASEHDIDLEFAKQRLAAFERSASLRQVASRTLAKALSTAPAEPWRCFVRPEEGFERVYDYVTAALVDAGVQVRTRATIESIRRETDGYAVRINGAVQYYDRIVSTIPLAATAAYFDLPVSSSVAHTTLLSLFFRLRGEIDEPGHYFYNFTSTPGWKRAVVFSRYYGKINGEHYFTVECTRRHASEVDLHEAAESTRRHLQSLSFIKGDLLYVGGCVTPNAYPLLERGYREKLDAMRSAVASYGIETTGRQGAFRYAGSNQVAESARAMGNRMSAVSD